MKFLKGFGLFFVYPLLTCCIGFFMGIMTCEYFYPGAKEPERTYEAKVEESPSIEEVSEETVEKEEALHVSSVKETLNADTIYILQETDVLDESFVESREHVPAMYLGMDREQFLAAMEQYEAFPPLAERERGFVGLEVVSFSAERVVVRMNYEYVQPSKSFYLAVANHEIVVLLEDKKTIYIQTGIRLEELPENVQQDIIDMRYVENEEKLYNFLEAYSS